MVRATVIIVGGGPAGSSCARELRLAGVDCLILDKQPFPRDKLCAGWITPHVLKLLRLNPRTYRGSFTYFPSLHVHFGKVTIHTAVPQYAIRRREFDHWLLQRAGVSVHTHRVRHIEQRQDGFVIDDQFACTYLVGAGGTACPVAKLFRSSAPRMSEKQITTLEIETKIQHKDKRCHLWFFENGMAGYSWYVPKKGGWLNIGIGAKAADLQKKGESIKNHWELLMQKLVKSNQIETPLTPKGYTYYLRDKLWALPDKVFLIGDAAGMATLDMGEGIGPAIESGINAARAIIGRKQRKFYSQYSLPRLLLPI